MSDGEYRDYLGDAVYVRRDETGSIVLTTEDGYRATNTIVFEPGVLAAFMRWLARVEAGDTE